MGLVVGHPWEDECGAPRCAAPVPAPWAEDTEPMLGNGRAQDGRVLRAPRISAWDTASPGPCGGSASCDD